MNRPVILALLLCAASTHVEPAAASDCERGHVPLPPASLDRALVDLVAGNGGVTAGVGLIDDGNLVWTGYYGEQEPGVPASPKTRFNVASITKTVAAETALRLVAGGKLDLDAPLAPYWVDFYQPSNDAVIVFLNAPNRRALSAMPDLISLLDSHSPYLSHYRAWLAREVAKERGKASRK